MKVAFGGVEPVSQPPRQPDRGNEHTGTSSALALPGIVFISPVLLMLFKDEQNSFVFSIV